MTLRQYNQISLCKISMFSDFTKCFIQSEISILYLHQNITNLLLLLFFTDHSVMKSKHHHHPEICDLDPSVFSLISTRFLHCSTTRLN